ncbi:MAG: TIGR04255 family protein [Bacteroidales bacterium]|nr:TIGR04255 family protein [Bacteroidales bacterium]
MSKIQNAPLLETILEIRWGEVSPNQFKFTKEEETLLPGLLASTAAQKGYPVQELIQDHPHPLPHHVTLRLRKEEDTWPCLQSGLGVFTINQLGDGYDWDIFKKDINEGLEIFKSSSEKLIKTLEKSVITLRYQDAFYPEKQEHIDDYLKKHFNISPSLPQKFFDAQQGVEGNIQNINMRFEIPLSDNLGMVTIVITNAVINNNPGLLIETVVTNNLFTASESSSFNIPIIMEWLEKAHDIQRHSFNTIIKESAYNGS